MSDSFLQRVQKRIGHVRCFLYVVVKRIFDVCTCLWAAQDRLQPRLRADTLWRKLAKKLSSIAPPNARPHANQQMRLELAFVLILPNQLAHVFAGRAVTLSLNQLVDICLHAVGQ